MVHAKAGGSALAPLESPAPGLTPAQQELRRRVLNAVSALTTKLAYGHALDDSPRIYLRVSTEEQDLAFKPK